MQTLEETIRRKTAVIGIIGVGTIGNETAVAFARRGFSVIGFDKNPKRIALLENTPHDPNLTYTTSRNNLAHCSVFLICVPTPLDAKRRPDRRALVSAASIIMPFLHKESLVVLESTTAVGDTRRLFHPLFRQRRLIPEKNIFLSHAPERIDPGNKKFTFRNTPRVIGGVGSHSTHAAVMLYRHVVKSVLPVGSLEAAEFCKLLENSFRYINLSFINEMAIAAEKLELDIWEILDAASTKPFGFLRHNPGPGVGGHCIPIDPLYLQETLKKKGAESTIIRAAEEVNRKMPAVTVKRIEKVLGSLKRKQIFLIGVTYKPNVADIRESPSIAIAHLLVKKGALVSYHDPLVPNIKIGKTILTNQSLTVQRLKQADGIIILTAHKSIDWKKIRTFKEKILDTRGFLR